ncbi:uncharacterized protein AB675_10869 [Cyphellophora attinorum]|uniref:Uncharacterized protein n=1 Tax=Cyphellophora attinorum TaxID=1664694 RepID=A0A0N1HAK0_9EURO|nr:uncharacterized protein AB675_10869 [Phialophora attinorum]KPI40895.1 hypothetical protein AB675_10869 [Phialophora attinorum]
MGAVVSCIRGMLQAIGNGIMAVIRGIGAILTGIVNAIVSFFSVLPPHDEKQSMISDSLLRESIATEKGTNGLCERVLGDMRTE